MFGKQHAALFRCSAGFHTAAPRLFSPVIQLNINSEIDTAQSRFGENELLACVADVACNRAVPLGAPNNDVVASVFRRLICRACPWQQPRD